jgi:hypothetical protein
MITTDRQRRMPRALTLTALALACTVGAVAAAPALAAPSAPKPHRGKTVVISRVQGRITARQPTGRRFTLVSQPQTLRVGGFVDASAGVAGVKIATRSEDWTAQLSHGSAQILQTSSGTTTFQLTGKLDCAKTASLARRRPRRPTSNSLWVGDNGGPFVSRGQYVSGAARGTLWVTTNYCNRTVVRVKQGKVLVTNLVTHHKLTVTAGHAYTATAAPVAPALKWSNPAPIGNGGELAAISCPTTGFCAAVNQNGDVVTSTDPSGGGGTWSTTSLVSDQGLNEISCPTAGFCVASDGLSGDVLVSTDPTGGAGAWSTANIVNPVGDGIVGLTCPSSGLCVAVDSQGNVFTTTDPTAGAGAWLSGPINPGNTFDDVSCAGSSLCLAVGAGISASANPAAGSSTWRTSTALAALSADACPTTKLCVVGDQNGNAYASTDPTGGPSTYKETENIDTEHPFQPITGISCQANGDCVVVGLSGDAVTTANPSGGAKAWSSKTIDSSTGLTDVSCPTADLCVAADQTGDVVIGRAG